MQDSLIEAMKTKGDSQLIKENDSLTTKNQDLLQMNSNLS
jgi:hypothetical protein